MEGESVEEGEGTKWLTIFAEEMKFTEFFQARGRLDVKKGEGFQRPLQSAEADSFPDGGSRERGLM